jgi:hypothetical protein
LGGAYEIVIQTGPGYPHTMPKVFAPDALQTKHVWEDGSLCVFKREHYSSSMSILDVRNHACSWCHACDVYRATSEWGAAEEAH